MRTHELLTAGALSATCLIGAVWGFAYLKSPQNPEPAASQLRLAGSLPPEAAVPVVAPILELTVPMNSFVRKGQVIGVSELGASPDSSVELAARWRLADTGASVAAAREQLRNVESRIAAARTGATDGEYQMISAEEAAVETEHAVASSDRLLRLGVETELQHDYDLDLQQAAQQQADTQRARAGRTADTVDELKVKRSEAWAALRDAIEQRGVAQAAVLNLGSAAETLPVVAPADGYLVMRDEYTGTFEITPNLRRRVVTQIRKPQLAFVRVGQPATVYVDGQPGSEFHAVVNSIGQAQLGASGGALFPVTLSLTSSAGIRPDHGRVSIEFQPSPESTPR